MNIIVKPYGNELCYCRPDTTWERENKDFYSPECVNEVWYAPVVFARIAKAGKCVRRKFAERYYDGIGCGILLYANDTLISYLDKSSILPAPLYNPVVFDSRKEMQLNIGNESLGITLEDIKERIENTICDASRLISLRIGDYIALELKSLDLVARRQDGEKNIKGIFCEKEIFDFRLIF